MAGLSDRASTTPVTPGPDLTKETGTVVAEGPSDGPSLGGPAPDTYISTVVAQSPEDKVGRHDKNSGVY